MNRQERRKIKREWNKHRSIINCITDCSRCVRTYSCDCTEKVTVFALPNTLVDVLLKVSEDLLLDYHLDMFGRWRLHLLLVVDGFFFGNVNLCFDVGAASDDWLDLYFGDNEGVLVDEW